jgi:hypothetical protein
MLDTNSSSSTIRGVLACFGWEIKGSYAVETPGWQFRPHLEHGKNILGKMEELSSYTLILLGIITI